MISFFRLIASSQERRVWKFRSCRVWSSLLSQYHVWVLSACLTSVCDVNFKNVRSWVSTGRQFRKMMSRTPFHAHTDPPGCIYRKDDRDIFFNSRETTDKDTAKADRKPVCKGAVNSFGVSPTNLKPVAAWDQAWYFASDASASLLDISGSSLSRDIQSALKPLFLFLFHPVPSCSTFRIVRRLMTSEKRLQRSVSSVSLGRPFAQGTRLDMAMPDLAFGLQIRVARHGTPWHALISDLYPICIRFLYPICIRFVSDLWICCWCFPPFCSSVPLTVPLKVPLFRSPSCNTLIKAVLAEVTKQYSKCDGHAFFSTVAAARFLSSVWFPQAATESFSVLFFGFQSCSDSILIFPRRSLSTGRRTWGCNCGKGARTTSASKRWSVVAPQQHGLFMAVLKCSEQVHYFGKSWCVYIYISTYTYEIISIYIDLDNKHRDSLRYVTYMYVVPVFVIQIYVICEHVIIYIYMVYAC